MDVPLRLRQHTVSSVSTWSARKMSREGLAVSKTRQNKKQISSNSSLSRCLRTCPEQRAVKQIVTCCFENLAIVNLCIRWKGRQRLPQRTCRGSLRQGGYWGWGRASTTNL